MKASVIIPCYNAAATLQTQLEALAKQEWSDPWEVILSDNGSTDDSRSIARAYGNRLPNFQIVDSSEVKGPARARNRGAQFARGESLIFCDADDEVANGWLAAMGNALKSNDFVACRFESEKLNNRWAFQARKCPQQNGVQTFGYPPFLPHAASAGIGIKRWIHEAVGGFDETMPMLEDTDYCWRVQLFGIPLVFVSDALLHYRLRTSIRKMVRQSWLWGEYNVFLYKKFRPMGMGNLNKKIGINNVYRLLKRMPYCMTNPQKRLQWLWDFSWQAGRAFGSVKYGVFAL